MKLGNIQYEHLNLELKYLNWNVRSKVEDKATRSATLPIMRIFVRITFNPIRLI